MPQLLLISGNGRNVGKTGLACKIINQLAKNIVVTAIKISPHFHAVQTKSILFQNENFIISEEKETTIKDSSLFLQAGASKVFFVISKTENLKEAFNQLLPLLPENPVVCESGGLHQFVHPGLHLFVKTKGSAIKKTNSLNTDALIIEREFDSFNFDIDKIQFTNQKFSLNSGTNSIKLMYDRFNRHINYLRISVTDRCNLRCLYCMPAEGVPLKNHNDILSFDEITEIVSEGVRLGITKIRLTGGEPLVRKNIDELIKMISKIGGISEIGMTTNGILLPQMARKLKVAGLSRVNISLDTLNPEKYKKISRLGSLDDVVRGIDMAIEADLQPVKINFVRIPDENKDDEEQVRKFCRDKNLKLRFIRQMNLETGEYYPVEGSAGGICTVCNRLRLTADGYLVPCLHSSLRYNVRELGIQKAFEKALYNKPEKGLGTEAHVFSNIGG